MNESDGDGTRHLAWRGDTVDGSEIRITIWDGAKTLEIMG